MNKYRVGVVIPVLSAFQDAVICLSRIRTKHIWTPYIGPQWEENKSISYVWNVYGSEAFEDGCDVVVILNDDSWVFPETIDNLIDEITNNDVLLVSGVNINDKRNDPLNISSPKKCGLDFSCFAIAPSIFDQVGYFDENFYPAYFEDNDFHWRMQRLNLDAYGITSAGFYHRGSTTYNAEKNRLNLGAYFSANKSYYKRKWGGYPGEEKYRTPFNNGGSVKEWEIED